MNSAFAQGETINMETARTLQLRFKAGETLSPAEQKYLDRARALRRSGNASSRTEVQMPRVSATACPVTELRVSDTSYAAVRKPPGDGPFPAVIFMHGGLGQSKMTQLRENALSQPTQTRFLSWGYVTVTATRRDISADPLDHGVVTDSLALLDAVRGMPHVDSKSVVLYGGSGGGTLALEVASVSKKVAAIAAGEPATIIYMGMFNKSHVIRDNTGRVTGDRRWDVMNADPHSLYTDELKERTRKKIYGISCPVLVMHGDQHQLKKFNFEILVPELKSAGKQVVVEKYAGEKHGFYWGRSDNPAMPLKANRDAHKFFQAAIAVQPRDVDPRHVELVTVE
jgi:dienelactone hydrolase